MSTQENDLQAFHAFVSRQLQNGGKNLTPQQSVDEFRAYQAEAERFIKETQESVDQADRGDAKPIDSEKLMDEVCKELAEEGITD